MNSITVIRNVLDVLGEVVATYIAIMTLNYLFIRQDMDVAVPFMMLVISVVLHFVRVKAKNKWYICYAGTILAVIVAVMPVKVIFRIVLSVDVYIQVAISWNYFANQMKITKVKEKVVLFAGLSAVSYVFCLLMGNQEFMFRVTVAIISLIIIVALEHYFDGMAEYIECSKGHRGISVKGMLSANTMILLSISVIMLVVILICSYLNVFGGVYKGAQWLLAKWKGFGDLSLKKGTLDDDIPLDYEFPPIDDEYTNVLDKLLNSIQNFSQIQLGTLHGLNKLIIVLIVFAILIGIYGMVRFIKALLSKTAVEGDYVERIADKEKVLGAEKKSSGLQEWLDPRAKMRKYYRKKMKGYQHDIVLNSYQSCESLEQAVMDNVQDDVGDLTKLYEYVRYGKDKVTEDMLKRAKKLSQKR